MSGHGRAFGIANSHMGAGEMSSQAFTAFLQQSLGNAAAAAHDGAIALVCMDWRHMEELLVAGRRCSLS